MSKLTYKLVPYIIVCKDCDNIYIPSDYDKYEDTNSSDLPALPCKHTNTALYKHDSNKVKVTEQMVEELKASETIMLESVCKFEGLVEKMEEAIAEISLDIASTEHVLTSIDNTLTFNT